MATPLGVFPFGQPVKSVEQADRSPKRVFVLGVYASAVHARWLGPDGRERVKALAVASEPSIFWRGDDAESILKTIEVPADAGELVPAAAQHNGPSGVALDERILEPMGLDRSEAWLCDLVPHSCVNEPQLKAIEREYLPRMDRLGLPRPSVSLVPKSFADAARRTEILVELRASMANVLILLGDQPIKWFLKHFDTRNKRLAEFGQSVAEYGRLHETELDGLSLQILPVAHPRQVAKLGRSSPKWFDLHDRWIQQTAAGVLEGT